MKTLMLVLLLSVWAFGQESSARHWGIHPHNWITAPPLSEYQPITPKARLRWFAASTAGPVSLLLAGPWSAGWGTLLNRPPDYGSHWDGFGSRYGMRLTGVSTGNALEAALGAVWGEDPRYFPSPQRGFGRRTKYLIKSAFLAPNRDGAWHPAYARYIANVGNNFLSNTWRARGENEPSDAAVRSLLGVVAEIGGNAFSEFWPDIKRKVFRKSVSAP